MMAASIIRTILFLTLTRYISSQNCNVSSTFSLDNTRYKSRDSFNCSYGSGPYDFTIVNPYSRQLAYYASEGRQCYNYYFVGMYDYSPAYSNPNGTNSSSISITQAPCILYPCCVILQCMSSLGCPNITLKTIWSDAPPSSRYYFHYGYVYYPLGGLGGLSISLFLMSRLCKKKDVDPALSEPIVPALSEPIVPAEETPLKIRKLRKPRKKKTVQVAGRFV
jgi:hypothetical protein